MTSKTNDAHELLTSRLALTVQEVARVTGTSVSAVRRAVDRNEIATTRLGHRILVPVEEVRRLLSPVAV